MHNRWTLWKLRNHENLSIEIQAVSDSEHFSFLREAQGTSPGKPSYNYIMLCIFRFKHDVTLEFHTSKCFDLSNLNMAPDLLKMKSSVRFNELFKLPYVHQYDPILFPDFYTSMQFPVLSDLERLKITMTRRNQKS